MTVVDVIRIAHQLVDICPKSPLLIINIAFAAEIEGNLSKFDLPEPFSESFFLSIYFCFIISSQIYCMNYFTRSHFQQEANTRNRKIQR